MGGGVGSVSKELTVTRRANDHGALVMFVMNDVVNDPRVQREARSAVRAGFTVTMVGLQRELDGGKLVTIYQRLAEEAAPRGATPDQ